MNKIKMYFIFFLVLFFLLAQGVYSFEHVLKKTPDDVYELIEEIIDDFDIFYKRIKTESKSKKSKLKIVKILTDTNIVRGESFEIYLYNQYPEGLLKYIVNLFKKPLQ